LGLGIGVIVVVAFRQKGKGGGSKEKGGGKALLGNDFRKRLAVLGFLWEVTHPVWEGRRLSLTGSRKEQCPAGETRDRKAVFGGRIGPTIFSKEDGELASRSEGGR